MSFQEEDEWLGLGSGFVLDDAFKCTSPLGADTSLQVPLREPSPIAVSPQNLMDFSFGDNSLAVPMREFGFQSGNDPPRLSPVSSSYQSMAPLQNMSYEMSSASVMQEESYNSFEQPSLVVNGHYQTMEQQVIQPQQGYFQTVSDAPPQQVMTTSTSHQQQTSSGGVSNASGSLVQQILSAPSTRQTPTPQHNRQRPIQPKTQNNGRKRGSVNSHSGANKSTKVDSSSNNTNQTEVRFSMSALTRITEIGAEMAQLQEQQEKLGINNSQRLSELQAQRASILYEALSSQNVGETVLSQVKQVAAAAAATPQPRSTPRSRASHANRQTHFESGQDSPQYQPQMYVASHNQYPSTSTAQFQEYSTGNANQAQVVHQQEQLGGRHQNQQRTFRTQNATTTVYHAPAQLPPGTVYVQNVPQAAQAQFTSAQPTVGEVVRQQHQLRHVSGAQQVIVQQVAAAPQVVVATGGQSVAGAQIRSQIVQQSPLPAQIVLAPPVQQSPQVVVVAHRASPAQAAKRLEEKRVSRLSRLRNYFDSLHASLANPDTETPFTDLRDVMQRLLPYHAYGEPNFSEEHLEQFDTNYMRTNINLHEQRKRLEKRLRKVFYDEALNGTEAEERNLLLFLDGEYTKRKLEEEKEYVKQGNIEAFVRDSAIVAALRGTDYEAVEKPKPATPSMKPSSSKSIMQQYEYHTFDETPRVVSPYKSPSPFKSPASSIRSPSPCKSPSSIAYSPRVRARNSSQSIHMSPAPVQEQARARTYSKSRTISESSRSDKSEVRRTPLPPPLPCAARRSTPLRRAVDKDSSKSSPMAPSSVTSAPGTPASVTSGPMTPASATTASTIPLPKVPSPVESAPEVPVPEAVSKRTAPAAPVGPAHTRPASSLPVKSATSRGSEREKEVLDSPTAVTTLGRLPAKKELLCRARQGVPAEMRSPPAHTSIATSLLYNRNSLEDEDSEGSASPELGIDDVIPLPSSQQPQPPVPKINAHPTQSKPVPVPPPPPPRLPPQKGVVPLPPPLPQRREKLVVPPERTSSPSVKQENVKPSGKSSVEDRPAERFRFKPQVPRPTPVSPLKPTVSKREQPADSGLMGKDVNCINHHAEEKVQMPNCVKPPPIRLKLKLSGKEVYIENNENSVKEGEKKHRKHKKKKKERHKEHIGSVKHLKEKLRSKGHRKLQSKKEKHEASPQELVAVTSNGVRMKLKFGVGANCAGPSAPVRTSLSSSESKEAQVKQKVVESKPSTSKATAPNETVRIPRLKIRIGPEAPALVIAPPDVKSASSSRAVQSPSTPSIGKAARRSKSPPALTAATVPSDTLAVEFSDDSDTEAERLRCATDKALRGMSNLPGMARSNTSVLPWSTQQAP